MAAGMYHLDLGAKKNTAPCFGLSATRVPAKPQTEIDIFKPEREEAHVEASAALKAGAPDQKTCAGGLLHLGGVRVVEIETPVSAIHRIIRKEPVY